MKVRFAREFADVGSITYASPESLSSASSFQSLNSSLSAKSSNGVSSVDSLPRSPSQTVDSSYVNPNISGLDDLILGCADIQLNSEEDQSSQDLSQDQTFASATDDLQIDRSNDFSLTDSQNGTQIIENESSTRESACLSCNRTQDIQDRPILLGTVCVRQPLPVALITNNRYNRSLKPEESIDKSISPNRSNDDSFGSRETGGGSPVNSVDEVSLPRPSPEEPNLNSTTCLSLSEEISDICKQDTRIVLECTSAEANPLNVPNCALNSAPFESSSLTEHEEYSLPGISTLAEHAEGLSLPSIPTLSSFAVTDSSGSSGNDSHEDKDNAKNLPAESSSPVNGSVAVSSSPQDALKGSPISEVQDKSSSLEEAISPSLYDAANGGESCTDNLKNDTPVERPKTPEVQQNSEQNVHGEAESNNIAVKVELSSPREASLEANVSPSKKEEVEDNKLNESPDTETIQCSEKVDSINLSVEEKEKENEEQFSEEKLDRTLTLEDVSFTAEAVPELEQYTEFKPQRQSTSLDTLSIEQPNFEDLKSAAEQVANDIFKSSLEFSNETDHFVSATSDCN